MKPTKFKMVMTDDAQEFEDQINELLKEGFSFLGEYSIKDNIFIQPMVMVEMVQTVPLTLAKKEEKK